MTRLAIDITNKQRSMESEESSVKPTSRDKYCRLNIHTVRGTSLLICCFSLAGVAAGMATTDWIHLYGKDSNYYDRVGLWRTCNGMECFDRNIKDVQASDGPLYISAAFLIAGLAVGILALILHIVLPLATTFVLISGALNVVGSSYLCYYIDDILDETKTQINRDNVRNKEWSWSFYLTMIGGCIVFVDGIYLLVYCVMSGCSMRMCPPTHSDDNGAIDSESDFVIGDQLQPHYQGDVSYQLPVQLPDDTNNADMYGEQIVTEFPNDSSTDDVPVIADNEPAAQEQPGEPQNILSDAVSDNEDNKSEDSQNALSQEGEKSFSETHNY